MPYDELVIYVRASQDKTGAGLSVDTQEAECRKDAARLGKKVRRVYRDNDISAANRRRRRPDYEQMLTSLQASPADVIVWHPDRLHRQPAELERYILVTEPRGILTYSTQAAPFDLATPSGRLIARILGDVAAHEIEHMSQRHKLAKRRNAAAGKPVGQPRSFGYSADGMSPCHGEIVMTAAEAAKRRLEPVREVATIRGARVLVMLPYDEAAELASQSAAVLAGRSVPSVARDWNTRGVLTSRGGRWDTTAVRRVLLRPRNAGLLEHKGRVVGPAAWPAVVSEAALARLRAILDHPDARTGQPSPRALGSGIYLCGVCGLTMRRNGGSRRNPALDAYRCSRNRYPEGGDTRRHVARNVAALDEYVSRFLRAWLNKPANIEWLMARAPDTRGEEADLDRLRADLDALAAEAGAGNITARQLAIASGPLSARVTELEARTEATRHPDITAGLGRSPAAIWAAFEADLDRKRAFLREVLTVVVNPATLPAGWHPGCGRPTFNPDDVEITPIAP